MTPDEPVSRESLRVVVLSGLSGAGKSTALHALEDAGYFSIDNLPVVLLPKLIELFPSSPSERSGIALVVDAREARFLDLVEENLNRIRGMNHRVEVLFLDSSDAALIRRYSETRRRHPLAPDQGVEEGIRRERALLEGLRRSADWVIDTSELNPHQLRELVNGHFVHPISGRGMTLSLLSFGFKYGIPAQADLVFDVRFLPNPFFVPELKPKSGQDSAIRGFVLQSPDTELFLQHVVRFLGTFRPLYDREGKSYLTVAIGCTGGRHRSVVLAEEIAQRLAGSGALSVRHRDLSRG